MNKHGNTEKNRFTGLGLRQKTIFLVVLCALSIIMGYASYELLTTAAQDRKDAQVLAKEYHYWKSRAQQSERDLNELSLDKYDNSGDFDLLQTEANAEGIILETESEYALAKLGTKTLKNFKIHQLKVNFNDVSLSRLIEFAEKIPTLGSNVAISETKVGAQQNRLLSAEFTISILEKTKSGLEK